MSVEGGIPVKSIIINQGGQQIGVFYGLDIQGDGLTLTDRGNFLELLIEDSTIPAGVDGNFQYNDNGVLGGSTGWSYDEVNARPEADNGIGFNSGAFTAVLTGVPTANRTVTLPNATTTLVGRDTTDILTNKTIDADVNTLVDIANVNIAATAAIEGTKINPDFGAQNITTTGALLLGTAPRSATGNIRGPSEFTIKSIVGGLDRPIISAVGGSTVVVGDATLIGDIILRTLTNGPIYHQVGGNNQLVIHQNGIQVGSSTADFGGGAIVIGIDNATTVPTTNPTGGGVQYATAGANTYRGSSGTVTTMAPA